MVVRIKKISLNELFIFILFLGPFLMAPLIQFLKFPAYIKYVMDISWITLLVFMILRKKRKLDQFSKTLLYLVCIYFFILLVNYIIQYQSIFYFLWGVRNNFRGYILFFATIFYFDKDDITSIFSIIDKIFYLNIVIMGIQFFFLGYSQDNLGGIFGVESGCNGYLNLFFCIKFAIDYVRYSYKEKKLSLIILNTMLMLIFSAMAELKFFYVEMIILLVCGSLITRFSFKKVFLIFGIILSFFIGWKVFITVFPDIDLSISGMIEYATSDKGYTAKGDLNRLHFMSKINSLFLKNVYYKIFGLGLGNCDYATGIELLTSPFSRQYSWMHYMWMSTAFTYLECGLIGLILLFGFFILNSLYLMKMSTKKMFNKIYCKIGILCGVIGILNAFYNISLRIEAGYMLYFVLALPYCVAKKRGKHGNEFEKYNKENSI